MKDLICINGIETNNLKGIDVKIVKNGINLIVGSSGSGKSSLAYDTIGQIGTYEFMSMFADEISEPTFKISSYSNMTVSVPIMQTNHNNNSRSTIGTYFGFNRSIGLIYSAVLGLPNDFFVLNKSGNLCEECHGFGVIKKLDYNKIINFNVKLKDVPFKCWNRHKDFYSQILINFCNEKRIDCCKTFRELSEIEKDIILNGVSDVKYTIRYKKVNSYSSRTTKFYGVLTNTPMLPNFNIGDSFYSSFECPCCRGKKYSNSFEQYKIGSISIGDLMTMDFLTMKKFINNFLERIEDTKFEFIKNKLKSFVDKAVELNLGHLCFNRSIPTLSGGELQRLRLIQVFSSQLSDLLIILDEPLAGLSGTEKKSVIDNILSLAKKHTIILVDHSDIFYPFAVSTLALGPGGGKNGGYLIDAKTFIDSQKNNQEILLKKISNQIHVKLSSSIFMYKGVDVSFAEGCLNLIFGPSGVGKSTLLKEYLPQYFGSYLYINQKHLCGNTNSCVATVLDISNKIFELFAVRYGKDKRFFSNLTGNQGVCPVCLGKGYIDYGDDFHSNLRILCKECDGLGFNKNLKKYKVNNKSIFDIWKLTLDEALIFFDAIDSSITKTCQVAKDLMLGHLQIGQPTKTLSGGENIRIKIINAAKSNAKIIGIDEPFKGLSCIEIYNVVQVFNTIRDKGKTLIIIDHASDINKYFSQSVELTNISDILVGRITKQYMG